MKLLVCTDGSHSAEDAVRFASHLAGDAGAAVTVVSITENQERPEPSLDALSRAKRLLGGAWTRPQLVARHGDAVREIVAQTEETAYDLVVIGATRGRRGPMLLSARAYEIVRAVRPAVLVVADPREALKRVLICTGGRDCIEPAIRFTASLVAPLGASVTLLHVMSDPPPFYSDLVRRAQDVERLLASPSELGRNLSCERALLEESGVPCTVRVRHGDVIEQVLGEARDAEADLVVTGTSTTRDPLRRYAMGDVTRTILERAGCPVLVVRGASTPAVERGFLARFRHGFGKRA